MPPTPFAPVVSRIAASRTDSWWRLRRWGSVVLTGWFCVFATPAAQADPTPKRVLIIHSFGREIAPFDAVAAAFRRELATQADRPVVFLESALDAGRPISATEEEAFAAYLKTRFSDPAPDLIATLGGPAAQLVQRRRDDLFPGVPRLMMGIDARVVPKGQLRPGDAVVATSLDPQLAFRNILQVRPGTRTIFLVFGDSPFENFWRKIFEQASAPLADRVRFEFLAGLPMAEIERRSAQLPPDAALLYGLLMVDGAGIPYERLDALARLRQVSPVPIFSLFGNELGRGVVGGPFLSESRVGAEAAPLALRSMAAGPPPPPVTQSIGMEAPAFDAQELTRWRIDESLLPPDSQLLFRTPSVWVQHRFEIAAVAVIMLAQVLLIIALLVQRSRRQRAEQEARALGGRLMTAYEDEGRRIARELHDDVTQRLASLTIEVAALRQLKDGGAREDAESSIGGALSRLGRDVHALAYRLHPSVIDDLGLEAALRVECDRMARRSGIEVELEADAVGELHRDGALSLLRVAQEALRNVERHASATHVRVVLKTLPDGVELQVSDDGCGFDPTADRGHVSLGLASMRERMTLLRGRLDIRSRIGGGTQVVAALPTGAA
jgi:signal transduction histidine kinase